MSMQRFYTTREAADVLRQSVLTVRRKCARGEIAATKAGHDWRISEAALTAYLEPTNQQEPAPEEAPRFITTHAKRLARQRGIA